MLVQMLNGLIVGSMYALVAIGFSLVLGVLDRLNFAHTVIFMVGGFAAVVVIDSGAPFWAAIPFSFLVGGILGLTIEFVCFRRIEREARITAALSSVAVGMIIGDLTQKIFGTDPPNVTLPDNISDSGIRILDTRVTWLSLIILGITLVLMVALQALITRARTGRNIRAVADSHVNASLLGVDVRRVTQHVFFVSSALAGVAGVLYSFRTGIANVDSGLTFGLKALAIMAIGGMGNMTGAVMASLAIGVLEGLSFYLALGTYSDLVVWFAMILVLLVKPSGIFGGGIHTRDIRA